MKAQEHAGRIRRLFLLCRGPGPFLSVDFSARILYHQEGREIPAQEMAGNPPGEDWL